jgi:hypothetical protein
MINQPRRLALFAVIAAGLLPAAGAQAQYNGATAQPAPLYPYAVRGHESHAVEVAPNTNRIRRPAPARTDQYVGHRGGYAALNRPHKKADRALIEKLRKRARSPAAIAYRDNKKRGGHVDSKTRVIQADAEITIHGPDRMSIRLFRKGSGGKANARAE